MRSSLGKTTAEPTLGKSATSISATAPIRRRYSIDPSSCLGADLFKENRNAHRSGRPISIAYQDITGITNKAAVDINCRNCWGVALVAALPTDKKNGNHYVCSVKSVS